MQDYRGHINEITHGLRFYVDPTDSLIFAGKLDHFLIGLISELYEIFSRWTWIRLCSNQI